MRLLSLTDEGPECTHEVMVQPNGPGSTTKSAPEGGSGSQPRSETPYPFYSLAEAVKVGEAVRKAGGNSAPDRDVTGALGLTSTQSRGWTYRVSSAREFGIIERTGRGEAARLQITELFARYAHPGSDEEKRAALREMVGSPTLYAQLLARYRGAPKPELQGLANVMWREYGILESVKVDAAKAFLSSIEFAGLLTPQGVIVGTSQPVAASVLEEAAPFDKEPRSKGESIQLAGGVQQVAVPSDFVIYTCKIGKGRLIKVPLPPEFTRAEVERLYAFLLTQVDEEG